MKAIEIAWGRSSYEVKELSTSSGKLLSQKHHTRSKLHIFPCNFGLISYFNKLFVIWTLDF